MRENIYSWAPTSNEVGSNILVVEMHEQNGEPLPITDKFGGELKTEYWRLCVDGAVTTVYPIVAEHPVVKVKVVTLIRKSGHKRLQLYSIIHQSSSIRSKPTIPVSPFAILV